MAKMNTCLLITCLALSMLFSYEVEVSEGSRTIRTKEVTTTGRPATGLTDMEYVTDHGVKYRYLTQSDSSEHVAIHSPVAYYGADELNDTTPGHSPGAGHSTGPGAATPVFNNLMQVAP